MVTLMASGRAWLSLRNVPAGSARHILLFVIVLAIAGYWSARWALSRYFPATGVRVRPYVARQVHFILRGDQETVATVSLMCRRRDGARHESESSFPSGGNGLTFRRVDFLDGRAAMIVDSLRVKSSVARTAQQVAAQVKELSKPPAKCLRGSEVLEVEERLFGQRAHRISALDASGETRWLYWRFPEFNCVTMQLFKQERNRSGGWTTTGGVRLTGFVEEDPDPQVFTNWAGYDEVTAEEMKRKLLQKGGKNTP